MEQNIKARQNDFVSHQQESNHAIPSEFQISAAASQVFFFLIFKEKTINSGWT
jgi:hypothetical protein